MLIIPAIDIRGGKVVRLTQGAYDKEMVYSGSPADMAKRWQDAGAEIIHVVDLDGAKEGRPVNLAAVEELTSVVRVKVEFGGGIRNERDVEDVFTSGVSMAVIGTKASEKKFLSGIVSKYGKRIVAGIDSRDGKVYTKGWLGRSDTTVAGMIKMLEKYGIERINYTDISRDGMLEGPNTEGIKALLSKTKLKIVAAGGISSLDDIKRLKELEREGLMGAIIGKALYEGRVDLKEAIEIAKGPEARGQGPGTC